jgi:hypothetical protein
MASDDPLCLFVAEMLKSLEKKMIMGSMPARPSWLPVVVVFPSLLASLDR